MRNYLEHPRDTRLEEWFNRNYRPIAMVLTVTLTFCIAYPMIRWMAPAVDVAYLAILGFGLVVIGHRTWTFVKERRGRP